MSQPEITAEFLTAGNARFLVTNREGTQYTFRIKRWESKKTGRIFFFVDAQERSQGMEFVKMGTMDPDTFVFSHGGDRAQISADHTAVKVFEWAVDMIFGEYDLPEGYNIKHCGTCGACGRPLSVEESVIRGIGPVCYGKAVENAKRVKILESRFSQLVMEV